MAAELKLINSPNLAQAALEIAKERREKLVRLCNAVLSHNYDEAETLAKELGGNETSNRTDQGFNCRTSGGG